MTGNTFLKYFGRIKNCIIPSSCNEGCRDSTVGVKATASAFSGGDFGDSSFEEFLEDSI